MKNKYLEVFNALNDILEKSQTTRNAHIYLQILLHNQLQDLENFHDSFLPKKMTRKDIFYQHANNKNLEKDTTSINKSVQFSQMQKFIEDKLAEEHCRTIFHKIGFIPVLYQHQEITGGAKKENLLWLDIQKITENHQVFDEKDDELEQFYEIRYERKQPNNQYLSWFFRFFFKNGELKMWTVKGVLLMLTIMLLFLGEILLLILATIILMYAPQIPTFSLLQLVVIIAIIPYTYLSIKVFFIPFNNLVEHRHKVIKAPFLFCNINADNVDVELYKGSDGYNIAKVTEFTSICPICSAPIILMNGKPDQKAPLVGRCQEAPHAHVYSFDRVLMKGYFLGHQGYLNKIPETKNS